MTVVELLKDKETEQFFKYVDELFQLLFTTFADQDQYLMTQHELLDAMEV